MRFLILALLLVGPASANAPESPGDRVTFTRAEIDHMLEELETMVKQREDAAFQRGQLDMRQRCPALI